MRIGSTLLIKDNKCVQSYKWKNIRPLGSIQIAIDLLEEYGVDEISIIRIIRSEDDFDIFLNNLKYISLIKSMTPLSFGGGIRTLKHLEYLKNLPIERLILSSEFINLNKTLLNKCINLFGSQAIQCILPFKIKNDNVLLFDSKNNDFVKLEDQNLNFINKFSNEIILYDINNEGKNNSFDKKIIDKLKFDNSKIIISGGIGTETIKWAKQKKLASVLIDNKVLHQEYSVKYFKKNV